MKPSPAASPGRFAGAATLGLQFFQHGLVAADLSARGVLMTAALPGLVLATLAADFVLATGMAWWVSSASQRGALIRLAAWLSASLLWLALVLDRVHFAIFFRHLQVEVLGKEGHIDPLQMLDSVTAEVDLGTVAMAAFALLAAAWLAKLLGRSTARAGSTPQLASAAVFALAAMLACLPGPSEGVQAAARHPLVLLMSSLVRAGQGASTVPRRPSLDLTRRRFGRELRIPQQEIAVEAWGEAGRALSVAKAPDVILLVLESTGARNFLGEDNLPDAEAMPTLASLASQATLFPRLYSPFPGTTRSHLHLVFGGHTLTWGGMKTTMKHEFHGPTLPKSFQKRGYFNGLFSTSYAFHSLEKVYEPLPFDGRNFPFPKTRYADKKLNSWGVSERILVPEVAAWREQIPAGKPAHLELHNQATHHPYSVPEDYVVPFEAETRIDRYRGTLHFTDSVLAQILEGWRRAGRLDNTLLAVCGDHGESFGRYHPTNRLHRDFLYEENLRNFLYVVDFRRPGMKMLTSTKNGMLGDLFPSIVHLAGGTVPAVPGANLFAPATPTRVHYFHKFGVPERWGLVDGQWKFMLDAAGLINGRLYDLDADPTEQTDLAEHHPEMVAEYTLLVGEWFLRAQEDLEQHIPTLDRRASDTSLEVRRQAGPRKLHLGKWPEGKPFKDSGSVRVTDILGAMAEGAPYAEDTEVRFVFTSPAGKHWRIQKQVEAGWNSYGVRLTSQAGKLMPGKWKVAVFRQKKLLAKASISVTARD